MHLYAARYLLPIGRPPLEDGALLVKDGLILAVGQRKELAAAHPGAAAVDFGECTLLPAMVNAHTHLELTDFPIWAKRSNGLDPAAGFVDWIRHLVTVRKTCTATDFRLSLSKGLQATLAAGVGMVGDILTNFAAARAYRHSPLRGRIFCEVLGHDSWSVAEKLNNIEKLIRSDCATTLAWGLAPHAPYSLSDATAAQIAAFAHKHDLQSTMHLAETEEEVEFLENSSGPIVEQLFAAAGWPRPQRFRPGLQPVAWAGQQNLLRSGSLVVHGVHVDSAGIDQIAASRCSVALCPRSNSAFGEARAPVQAYRRAGVNLSLGTDSLASAPSLSIWEELAFARHWFSELLSPDEWLEIATLGGARALGLASTMGSLEPGKQASFQVVAAPVLSEPAELGEALCSLGASVRVRELFLAGKPVWPQP